MKVVIRDVKVSYEDNFFSRVYYNVKKVGSALINDKVFTCLYDNQMFLIVQFASDSYTIDIMEE